MAAFPEEAIVAACQTLLANMAREAVKRNPLEQPRVPTWPSLSIADRGIIVRSVSAALSVADKIREDAAKSHEQSTQPGAIV